MINFKRNKSPTKEEIIALWKEKQIAQYGECKACGWWPRPMGIIPFDQERERLMCYECGEDLEVQDMS